jgi:hypothetical protein
LGTLRYKPHMADRLVRGEVDLNDHLHPLFRVEAQ